MKSPTNTTKALMFTAVFMLCLGFVSAETVLDVTISEVVDQNVTFAENFNLVEEREYALIIGEVAIQNPSTITVYDADIRFDNVENLITDFIYTSGRESFQVIYPNIGTNTTTYSSGEINSSQYFELVLDIDEDGINDSVTHNNTHIIFNITSENELFSFPFSNATNDSIDISQVPAQLDMNISLESQKQDLSYNEGHTFGNFSLQGTVSSAGIIDLTQVSFSVTDNERPYAIIHVPELRAGQETILNYNISSETVNPPLEMSTEYTNEEFNTKVLAGEPFGVTLTATNVATVGALNIVNITMQAEQVVVENGTESEAFNFTLHNLSETGDWQWVFNTTNRTWDWYTNNGTIPVGESYNISFDIRAPDTVPSSATFLALTNYLRYTIDTTASELYVSDIRVRSQIDFGETKRIVSPQDNESNNNVTWESTPSVQAAENLTYTLERVSLWVTEVRDPNQKVDGLQNQYNNLDYDLNLSNSWTGANWYFNFTDGSTQANPPPIVWMKPYWIIKNTDNQIINSSFTVNGTDLYMNYIYVVNGYWLEVDKQVLDVGDGEFDIKINVSNRGIGYTPQNMTVTIYDFIPSEFDAHTFSPTADNDSQVTGEFSGTAYQWDVGLRTNLSTSFSPRGAADGLDTFQINYSVNGTGDFQVSDLYIIGLDPRLVDGAGLANEAVAVISAVASTSREVIYLAVVVFLIGINMANFMMTRKISSKLDR